MGARDDACRKNWARIDSRCRRAVLIGERPAIGRALNIQELASRISVREWNPYGELWEDAITKKTHPCAIGRCWKDCRRRVSSCHEDPQGNRFYKIPSLRGVWYRPLLLHDGSVSSLEEMFDPDRLKLDHVPGGWKGPGVT